MTDIAMLPTDDNLVDVVLSGSGTLYPMHAGALWALHARGYVIRRICGVSGGSLMAAFIACGVEPGPALNEMIMKTLPGPNRLVDPACPPFPFKWGMIQGDRMLRVMRKVWRPTFGQTDIPLHVVTVNTTTRRHQVWSTGETPAADLPLVVRASMAIPGVFTPVKLDGHLHVDGGVAANFPIDIFGDGEDVVGFRFGQPDGATPRRVGNLKDYAMSVVETMLEAPTREHLSDAMYARVCGLKPDTGMLNLLMDEAEADRLIRMGYDQASAWLDRVG